MTQVGPPDWATTTLRAAMMRLIPLEWERSSPDHEQANYRYNVTRSGKKESTVGNWTYRELETPFGEGLDDHEHHPHDSPR